jgi:uncharacterized protein DUF1064
MWTKKPRVFKSKKLYRLYLSAKAFNQWREGSLKGFKKTKIVRAKIAKAHIGKNFVSTKVRSLATSTWIKEKGHPRGMLGKHHTLKTRKRLVEYHRLHHRKTSLQERKDASTRLQTYILKHKEMWGNNKWKHIKRGFRKDIGNGKIFFRSAREANYARFLNWRIKQGEILKWEYEPKTFIFHKIELGTRSYTPDFRITNLDKTTEYHEIKGFYDAKSRTKINRMRKYYPDVKLVLIKGQKEFKQITHNAHLLIKGWE